MKTMRFPFPLFLMMRVRLRCDAPVRLDIGLAGQRDRATVRTRRKIMKIALASDHAGYDYKQHFDGHLRDLGHTVVDFGTDSTEPCDYPDFVHPAALSVASGRCERGIVLGGSGNGEAMTANRHERVRCALCWNVETARLSRRHNEANMLSIGQRIMELRMAIAIVDTWLNTEFEYGRHTARIRGIDRAQHEF